MLEQTNTYQAGNTIRLLCIFEDFDGNRVNPNNVRITFYNYKYEKIQENVLSINNRQELGVYFFNYLTSKNSEQRIIYEWYGEIGGFPSIKRGSFRTVFI